MEEKVVLNVKYPIVNCYPATSNALAILQNYEEVEGWIFNNFIQMFSTDLYTIVLAFPSLGSSCIPEQVPHFLK